MGIGTSDGEYYENEAAWAVARNFPKPDVPVSDTPTFEDSYMDSVVVPELNKQDEFETLLKRFKERYDEVKKAGDMDHAKDLERHIMDIYDEITKGREPIKFPEPDGSTTRA